MRKYTDRSEISGIAEKIPIEAKFREIFGLKKVSTWTGFGSGTGNLPIEVKFRKLRTFTNGSEISEIA